MEQSFLCEKEGRRKRFTLRQLQAMGQSTDQKNYNGWVIIEDPKVPEELLQGIIKPLIDIPEAKTGKGKSKTKAAADSSATKQTENKDEHSGETEAGAEGSGADASGEAGEDSSQSSQGDGKAE